MNRATKMTLSLAITLIACSTACKQDTTNTKDDEQPTETAASKTSPEARETTPKEVDSAPDPEACAEANKKAAVDAFVEKYGEDFGLTREDVMQRHDASLFKDLDGDGKKEGRVTVFHGASATVQFLFNANDCDTIIGTFETTGIGLEETKTAGWYDINSWFKDGCAGLSGTYSIHAWDAEKKTYAQKESVSCGCDPSPDRSPKCPEIPE